MATVWSVRGVDPRVRDAVVAAARERKTAVAVVLEEAVECLLNPPVAPNDGRQGDGLLREIDARLDRLRERRRGRTGA